MPLEIVAPAYFYLSDGHNKNPWQEPWIFVIWLVFSCVLGAKYIYEDVYTIKHTKPVIM
jgi:hypothetical protein